jgi:Na+/proline symporter
MSIAITLTLVYAAVLVVTLALCRMAGRADKAMDRELVAARRVRFGAALCFRTCVRRDAQRDQFLLERR